MALAISNFNDGKPRLVRRCRATTLRWPVWLPRELADLAGRRVPDLFKYDPLDDSAKPLGFASAAIQARDTLPRAIEPVRAFRAAMTVRAQPARANENLLCPATAWAFLWMRLPLQDTTLRLNDRVHPFRPQRLGLSVRYVSAFFTLEL